MLNMLQKNYNFTTSSDPISIGLSSAPAVLINITFNWTNIGYAYFLSELIFLAWNTDITLQNYIP